MCTISFDSNEIKVLLDAVTYFSIQALDRLKFLDCDDLNTHYESVWRNNYEMCNVLLEKINRYGKFE